MRGKTREYAWEQGGKKGEREPEKERKKKKRKEGGVITITAPLLSHFFSDLMYYLSLLNCASVSFFPFPSALGSLPPFFRTFPFPSLYVYQCFSFFLVTFLSLACAFFLNTLVLFQSSKTRIPFTPQLVLSPFFLFYKTSFFLFSSFPKKQSV